MKNEAGWCCFNCLDNRGVPGKIVEADVCDCGLDHRDPEYAQYVKFREVVHFDPPHRFKGKDTGIQGKGVGRCACDPKKMSFGNCFSSGHVAAVTCKKCKETDAFKGFTEVQTAEVPPEADHLIEAPEEVVA